MLKTYGCVIKETYYKAIVTAEMEQIRDLNCLIFNVPITIDYSDLINFNCNCKWPIMCAMTILAEFFDYFAYATPAEIVGVLVESTLLELQSISNGQADIDRRQIFIDFKLVNPPASFDFILESGNIYSHFLPTTLSLDGSICSIMSSAPKTFEGYITSLSDSIYVTYIVRFQSSVIVLAIFKHSCAITVGAGIIKELFAMLAWTCKSTMRSWVFSAKPSKRKCSWPQASPIDQPYVTNAALNWWSYFHFVR